MEVFAARAFLWFRDAITWTGRVDGLSSYGVSCRRHALKSLHNPVNPRRGSVARRATNLAALTGSQL